jgi:hypothetical protein
MVHIRSKVWKQALAGIFDRSQVPAVTDLQNPKCNLALNSKDLRLNRYSKIEAISYFGLTKFITTLIQCSTNFFPSFDTPCFVKDT